MSTKSAAMRLAFLLNAGALSIAQHHRDDPAHFGGRIDGDPADRLPLSAVTFAPGISMTRASPSRRIVTPRSISAGRHPVAHITATAARCPLVAASKATRCHRIRGSVDRFDRRGFFWLGSRHCQDLAISEHGMPRPLRRVDRLRQIERPIGDAAPPPALVGELVEHRRPSRVPALGRHAVHETPRALRRDLNAASRAVGKERWWHRSLPNRPASKIPVVTLTTAVVSFTNANSFAFVSGGHSARP